MKWVMETFPVAAGDSRGEDDNPRRYDAFAREYPGYRETSRDLIALALPSAALSGRPISRQPRWPCAPC
jgi:hypothetical protein